MTVRPPVRPTKDGTCTPARRQWSGRIWAIVIASTIILTTMIVAISISVSISDERPTIGHISIAIEGRDVIVSADIETPSGMRLVGSDLDLESGEGTYPVEVQDMVASVSMGVTDLAAVLKSGEARLTGSVKVELDFPPISVERHLEQVIDIAALLDLNRSLSPSNVTIGLADVGEIRIGMDLTSEPMEDLSLDARNTSATIRTAFGSTTGYVDLLSLDEEGGGMASVRVPTLAIIPITLGRNLITVDFWGFTFSFRYPLNG